MTIRNLDALFRPGSVAVIGDSVLLSRVTRKSADALGLVPGKRLFAQIKTVALLA